MRSIGSPFADKGRLRLS